MIAPERASGLAGGNPIWQDLVKQRLPELIGNNQNCCQTPRKIHYIINDVECCIFRGVYQVFW